MSDTTRDRYISFDGLECDENATTIVSAVRRHIEVNDGPWTDYFTAKFAEQKSMGTDDLFFIGSQLNNLYAFFEAINDTQGSELLYQVEQECC